MHSPNQLTPKNNDVVQPASLQPTIENDQSQPGNTILKKDSRVLYSPSFFILKSLVYALLAVFMAEFIVFIASSLIENASGMSLEQIVITFILEFFVAFNALKKGFEPIAWLIAGGLLALIVISLLPSGRNVGNNISDDIKQLNERNKRNGNVYGLICSGIAIVLLIVIIIIINLNNSGVFRKTGLE